MPDTFFSDFGPYSITQLLQFTSCTSTMRISHPNQIPKVLDWRSGDCGNQFGMIWASCHGVVSCWNQLSEDGNAVVRKEVRKKTRNHPPRDHTITPAVWTKKHPNVDAVYTKFWPPPSELCSRNRDSPDQATTWFKQVVMWVTVAFLSTRHLHSDVTVATDCLETLQPLQASSCRVGGVLDFTAHAPVCHLHHQLQC